MAPTSSCSRKTGHMRICAIRSSRDARVARNVGRRWSLRHQRHRNRRRAWHTTTPRRRESFVTGTDCLPAFGRRWYGRGRRRWRGRLSPLSARSAGRFWRWRAANRSAPSGSSSWRCARMPSPTVSMRIASRSRSCAPTTRTPHLRSACMTVRTSSGRTVVCSSDSILRRSPELDLLSDRFWRRRWATCQASCGSSSA